MEPRPDVAVFVRVVEEASFAKAAASLGISRSYASRVVAGLEARLGVRLLHRTTRRVAPTPSGQAFFEACQPLVEGLAEAEARVREEADEPQGTLRLSLPLGFGVRYLVEPVVRFQEAHPRLRVIVDYDDRKVDLVDDGYDLAVRGGAVPEGAGVVRPLWRFRLFPVASPSYLARAGTPEHPRDLAGHRCALYTGNLRPNVWAFTRDGVKEEVTVEGAFTTNSSQAMVEAAIHGAGIAMRPDFLVVDALRAGTLVRVLPDWELPWRQFWAVRPSRRFAPARVRAFLDHLARAIPDPPWLRV